MTKLTKNDLFKTYDTKPESLMDKTTRVVRQIAEEETEKREAKVARLREARLEKEANSPPATKSRRAPPLRNS